MNEKYFTTASAMHEEPFHISPKGRATSPMSEQRLTSEALEQQTASPLSDPSTNTIMERMEREMNQEMNSSPHSRTFSELLNDQCIEPAVKNETADEYNAVELKELPGLIALTSHGNDGPAPLGPQTVFNDVADMSPSEFDQLLASTPSIFAEDLCDPMGLNTQAEHNVLLDQGVGQAVGEPFFAFPDLSPDALDRIFGPTPAAFNESNPLAENAVDVVDFGDIPQAGPDSLPGVSPTLSNLLSPVQQYPHPAPGQVYPPIPDKPEDIYRLSNQPGQHPYPPSLQNSNIQPQSVLYESGQPLGEAWPQTSPRKISYTEVAEPRQDWHAIPPQVSHVQGPNGQQNSCQAGSPDRDVSQRLLTERQILQPRPRRTNLVPAERVQNSVDAAQSALAAPKMELFPPRSQGQVSPRSDASTDSSSEHPIIKRRETPKPKMPKSLASNYYRIYAADENDMTAKAQKTNARTQKILGFKPEEHYTPLERPPKPWDVFTYTDKGELQTSTYYTSEEIRRYLYNNPQHRRKGLILWIQRKPADSGRRYPNFASQRCRFANCAARGNLIGSGQYRVAFDQLSLKCKNYDPHYNAGYVHLYCLEKFLDFPELCQHITIRPENRKLPEEPKQHNNMALSLKEEIQFAKFFIRNCKEGRVPPNYPHYKMPNRPHEGTLTHALSCVKLQYEPKTAKKRRADRGTKTALEWHMGDLERETELSARPRAAKKGLQTKDVKAKKRGPRDDQSDDDGEGSGDDSEAEFERPQKRQKMRQIQEEEVEELVNPLAGPLTRSKKRSIDQEAEESSPKRKRSP